METDASADIPALPAGVEATGLLDGLCTTRAIRRLRSDPIPDDHLATIMFAATRAPSGSNRQPFRFIVLRDGPRADEAKGLLGRSFREQWSAKRAADGYDAGTGIDGTSPKARMARTMQRFVDHVEAVPVIVVACLIRHRDPHPTEAASVYPACQNLLLAARALGYGGVLTVWHQASEPELRALLEIPDHVLVAGVIPLGRPEGRHGPVRRRPVGELVWDDGWDTSAPWAVEPSGARHTSSGPQGT